MIRWSISFLHVWVQCKYVSSCKQCSCLFSVSTDIVPSRVFCVMSFHKTFWSDVVANHFNLKICNTFVLYNLHHLKMYCGLFSLWEPFFQMYGNLTLNFFNYCDTMIGVTIIFLFLTLFLSVENDVSTPLSICRCSLTIIFHSP